jgi:hypothetical protein
MKFDLSNEVKDLDGTTLFRQDKPELPVTLDYVIRQALFAQYLDEKAEWEEKEKRYKMALKVNENPKEVDLNAEEITLVKKLVGKAYGANVVGRLSEAIKL